MVTEASALENEVDAAQADGKTLASLESSILGAQRGLVESGASVVEQRAARTMPDEIAAMKRELEIQGGGPLPWPACLRRGPG